MLQTKEPLVQSKCFHCGDECTERDIVHDNKHFCCNGCLTVFEILDDNNLCGYYDLNQNAGLSLKSKNFAGRFDFLTEPSIESELLAFNSENLAKVLLYIPSIHCSSCVWLLENFKKLIDGVNESRLNFVKKELSISYNKNKTTLKEIIELLATLGYEPQINLSSLNGTKIINHESRNTLIKIGVVGFCAGNIMLLSFPEYFGFNNLLPSDLLYHKFFLFLNFILSLPVFLFGSKDYLIGAYRSIVDNFSKKSDILSVDIPIAIGISTLFFRSCYETFMLHQAGYWDSLSGLVLFLLIGKWVQQTTFGYLSFDRNYKSYFPLAVQMKANGRYKNVKDLKRGDEIVIHNKELIPADAVLKKGKGLIDYSFVTGESEHLAVKIGDVIYAGGRQTADLIELEIQKEVATSYLTQLWNNENFLKEKNVFNSNFSRVFGKYFTSVTIIIALATGVYWYFVNPSLIWDTVTAVFMVACPCALTLAMPFTMNTTMSIFGRNKFYVKNQYVIQSLTEIDTIVFDKTGTLTNGQNTNLTYYGKDLNANQKALIANCVRQSMHPLSKQIESFLKNNLKLETNYFFEVPGKGLEAIISGIKVNIGNSDFVGISKNNESKTAVYIKIENEILGQFIFEPQFRNNWQNLISKLKTQFSLHLISGDRNIQNKSLEDAFSENLRFNQSPMEKLNYVNALRLKNQYVAMIGDGLNDSGALKAAHVGIALTEDIQAFSPACDAILDAENFEKIFDFVNFSKKALLVVKLSFALSLIYNFVGLTLAIMGLLSPMMAAIFMPFSSISVVLFSVGLTLLFAKFAKL